jgi:hypothetical protein
MNPSDSVTWVCQHQDLVTNALLWLFAVVPVASAVTWFQSTFDKLPPWLQAIIQVLAGNFLHAIKNPPVPAPAPVPPQEGPK